MLVTELVAILSLFQFVSDLLKIGFLLIFGCLPDINNLIANYWASQTKR